MNTVAGIAIAMLIGVLAWGLPRFFILMPSWAERVFWIVVVLGLVGSIYIASPQNMAVMALLAGSATAENLIKRFRARQTKNVAPATLKTRKKKTAP